jgi:uncharacterized membrane protein YphA (DoxX/SURF4 family)
MAIVMLARGINDGRNPDGTASWFESIGFRQPRLNARMSAAEELAIGLGIATGLPTSLATINRPPSGAARQPQPADQQRRRP